jgi:hypothetical protein
MGAGGLEPQAERSSALHGCEPCAPTKQCTLQHGIRSMISSWLPTGTDVHHEDESFFPNAVPAEA